MLASCYELVAALDSGDPSAYISHLPVHQDGTCNGLQVSRWDGGGEYQSPSSKQLSQQHYAALGGDVEGAKQVNVIPTEGADVPQDVYTAVARRMDAIIAQVRDTLENFFLKLITSRPKNHSTPPATTTPSHGKRSRS